MLLAYCKMWLFDELLASDLPDDPWVAHRAGALLPAAAARAASAATSRAIRCEREIIATHVAQQHGQPRRRDLRAPPDRDDRRAAPAQVVRAYLLTREVFGYVPLWQQIEALDNKVRRRRAVRDADRGRPAARRARPRGSCARARLAEPMEQTFERFTPGGGGAARAAGDRGAPRRRWRRLDRGRRAGAAGAARGQRRRPVRRARHRRGGRSRAAQRGRGRRGARRRRQRASAWRGCASRSTRCRPTATGRRWPRTRSATTWRGCSARSRRRCWAAARAAPAPAARRVGSAQRRPRWSVRSGCWRSWATRRRWIWRCCRSRCASCATWL